MHILPKKMGYERKKSLVGFLFVLPWLLGFIFIVMRALIDSAMYSFCETTITTNGMKLDFAGLTYYIKAFRSDLNFSRMLISQFSELIYSVPLILAFSLFMAVILNQKFIGRTIARSIFFIPVIIGSGGIILSYLNDDVSSTMLGGARSAMLFSDSFSITEMLGNSGLPSEVTDFVSAAVSNVFDLTWKSGLQIVLFIAGLQGISTQLYEAADVEGATAWEKFWKITFPMIMPILMVNLIYTIIDNFTDYGNRVIQYITNIGRKLDFSYSSALSWIYFLIIGIVIGLVYFLINRRVTYTVK